MFEATSPALCWPAESDAASPASPSPAVEEEVVVVEVVEEQQEPSAAKVEL